MPWGRYLLIAVLGAVAVAWLHRGPASAEQYRKQGIQHTAIGRFPEAIAAYSNAIGRAPADADLYRLRASAHMVIADYAAALADLEVALRLDGDLAQARYDRAVANYMLGRRITVCADLQHACRLGHARACEQAQRAGCRVDPADGAPAALQ